MTASDFVTVFRMSILRAFLFALQSSFEAGPRAVAPGANRRAEAD
jgi:hypothetical protein